MSLQNENAKKWKWIKKKTPNDYRMYPFLRHNATQNGTTSEENSQRSLIMGANDVADGRKTGKKYKKRLGVL